MSQREKKPLRIFTSTLTDPPRYYASSAYREDKAPGRVVIIGTKHDVTDEVRAIIEATNREITKCAAPITLPLRTDDAEVTNQDRTRLLKKYGGMSMHEAYLRLEQLESEAPSPQLQRLNAILDEELGANRDAASMGKLYRIVIRCSSQPDRHAKILQISGYGRAWIEEFAKVLDGTSPFYLKGIGPLSPIGKCCTCGARIEVAVMEVASA